MTIAAPGLPLRSAQSAMTLPSASNRVSQQVTCGAP